MALKSGPNLVRNSLDILVVVFVFGVVGVVGVVDVVVLVDPRNLLLKFSQNFVSDR